MVITRPEDKRNVQKSKNQIGSSEIRIVYEI